MLACMYVCVPEESIRSPGTGVRGQCVPPCDTEPLQVSLLTVVV